MITIIILLILAVVSVRAIKDGGILSKTQTAKETYSESEEKEKIKLAINQAAIDGVGAVNRNPLETALKEQFKDDFQIIKETEEYFEVKIKSSGRIYTINKNGSIDNVRIGKKGESWADNGNGSYTKGNETIEIGKTTYTNDEVKAKLKDKGIDSNDGSYTGNWEVIGIENDEIKIVSAENVTNSYYLGYEDPEAKDAVKVANEDSLTNEDKLKRAAYSYAHVVETLNKVVSETTGIKGARSVTIEDIYAILDKAGCGITDEDRKKSNLDYGTIYKYYCDDTTNGQVYLSKKNSDGTWKTGSEVYNQPFTYTNEKKEIITIGTLADGNINKGKMEITYTMFKYNLNETQKGKIGSLNSSYWLSSTCVDCNSSVVRFRVHYMDSGNINYSYLFNSYMDADSVSRGVRAVVYI